MKELFDLTARIRYANKAVLRAAADCTQNEKVSHTEMSLLSCLKEFGDITVPRIAEIRQMSRQSVQSIVNALVARGILSLVSNPHHSTSKLVRPTLLGVRVRKAIDQRARKSIARVAKGFKRRDLKLASQVLEELATHIDEVHPL